MAKGGFTGAVPPRETSPEEYSGVWDITEQYGEQKAGSWPFQADDCAPKSLRLDQASSAYLTRTPVAAGNRKTWTFNCWIKRLKQGGTSGTQDFILTSIPNLTHYFQIYFSSDLLYIQGIQSGQSSSWSLTTNQVFRDPSAWMMLTFVHDSTQVTANERFKVYLNGQRITSFSTNTLSSYLPQNSDSAINSTQVQRIGTQSPYSSVHSDLMIAEATLIDGQTLDPTDFGFFDGAGIWQPKRFTGDYSSGPVYTNDLDYTASYTGYPVSNLFDGDANSQWLTAAQAQLVTFTPSKPILFNDTLKIKFGGASHSVVYNGTTVTSNSGSGVYTVVASGGGTLTSLAFQEVNSGNYTAVYYIEVDGQILTDASVGRNSFHLDFSDGVKDQSGLNNDWTANNLEVVGGGASTVSAAYTVTGTTGTADLTSLPNSSNSTFANIFDGTTQGFYTGSSSSFSATVTLAQAIPYTSTTIRIYHATLNNIDVITTGGTVNASTGGSNTGAYDYNILPAGGSITGFTFNVNSGQTNDAVNYIEVDGQKINLFAQDNDIFVDSPVNGNEASTGAGGERRGNYCCWNPLVPTTGNLANGNLEMQGANAWRQTTGTIAVSSGKWYYEATYKGSQWGSTTSNSAAGIGFYKADVATNTNGVGSSSTYNNVLAFIQTGYFANFAAQTSIRTQIADGDVIGVSVDLDAGTYAFYINGSSLTSGNLAYSGALVPWTKSYYSNSTGYFVCNFGQRAFSHTPPANHSPLATSFLTEPTIKRGDEAMDVALYTGNGTSINTISGLSISPDLVWLKRRNSAGHHSLYDAVRGAYKHIGTSHTTAEYTESTGRGLSAFNSDGFTINTSNGEHVGSGNINVDNGTYAAWTWDAGEVTTTIAAGSLNSSAYASGRTWSSDLSATSLANQGKMFDWTYGYGSYTGTCTWTTTNAAYSSLSGRVYLANNTTVTLGITFKDSGNNVLGSFNLLWTGDGTQMQDTGFDWSSNVAKVEITGDYLPVRVQIGNQTLVDTGTTVPNVPSIASTVRANPTAGFSIATYTSPNSSSDQSFAHGLNSKPEFVIVKNRDSTFNWDIYHGSLGYNASLIFTTAATRTGAFSAEPTSFVVNTKTNYTHNGTDDYVAYCFAPVDGYSSAFTYTGNGSTSGPFVYLGFRPKFFWVKRTDAAGDWWMYDTARNPYNVTNYATRANSSAAEVSDVGLDILSNGFKYVNDTGAPNISGATYIGFAWAESPFKTARAR